MKVIIAGSRSITDYGIVIDAIIKSKFKITEVVSGCAKGVDQLGERWAMDEGIKITRFPANWKKYGSSAGPIRNQQMIDYVGAKGGLIAVWDKVSTGTWDVYRRAKKKKSKVYLHKV